MYKRQPQKELSALLDGIPVKSGNDANVAALGEMWQGGGKGYDNLVIDVYKRQEIPFPSIRIL